MQQFISHCKGVDIIAEKRGLRAAIQCKNWSDSAGISAVQEVYSGVSLYKADFAVLVIASELTEQAKQAVKALKVLCINKKDLYDLDILLAQLLVPIY